MMNIVVPMAGAGSRFANVGYNLPKPLIDVGGRMMCEIVYHNLKPSCHHQFCFIVQQSHIDNFDLGNKLTALGPGISIFPIDSMTAGAACTVLTVKDQINTDQPLMIANCDQYIDINIDDYLQAFENSAADGYIMTMTATDPKWSFARVDGHGYVTEVREKQPISHEATVGIYNFANGEDFVTGAEQMIAKNIRTNNEFYVAPVYNELIAQGQRFGVYNIGSQHNGMHGIGTPDDLQFFLSHPACARATTACA